MKKTTTAIIIGALIASLSLTTATAAETKSLVILDSYFDSRVLTNNVSCITLDNNPCVDIVTKIPKSLSDNINHGNAMVEVAKKQSSDISIIALSLGSPSKSSVTDVNAGNFIQALEWVSSNSSKVGAVSISRYFNGQKECTPSSQNTAQFGGVAAADLKIRNLISSLKNKGVKVFVAAGNKRGTKMDYPACILETESVGVGSLNKSNTLVSNYAANNDTDYFVNLSIRAYNSPILGLIANTTSSANVAVAVKYLTGKLDNKFVNVLN